MLDQLTTFVQQNQMVVGLAVALIILFVYAYKEGVFDDDEADFKEDEAQTQEEISKEALKSRMSAKGIGVDTGIIKKDPTLRISGWNNVGKLKSYYVEDAPSEFMAYQENDNDSDDADKSVHVFKTEVGGFIGKYIQRIKATFGGESPITYWVVDSRHIKEDQHGFVVSDKAQLKNLGSDIMHDWTPAATNVAITGPSMAKALYEASKNYPEYVKLMNFLNYQQSSNIQSMEKANELDMETLLEQAQGH